jgi:hypothetical protein
VVQNTTNAKAPRLETAVAILGTSAVGRSQIRSILLFVSLRYCGVTSSHCGTGCQSDFGDCFIPVGSGELPSSGKVSLDGTCGGSAGLTCGGSNFGNSCSSGGYFGSSVNHCAKGWFETSFLLFADDPVLTILQSELIL